MNLPEYIALFVLVAIMGAGIPGPGDAALIAAGCRAGEGKLNVGFVLLTALVAWMLGSVIGFWIGQRGGRPLLTIRDGWRSVAGSCWPRAITPSASTPSSRP